MSKKNRNQNIQQMKHRIHEQQKEIERLKYYNRELSITVNEMHLRELQQFSDVITCVFEQFMMDVIDEDQAGKMMVALVGAFQHSGE